MAVILAVNPGGTQSGTLARLAREMQGHELIGADSCDVAGAALEEHKPAVVLLPAATVQGEQELLTLLRTAARGGIPMLRLPPPTSVNPRALADEIRQLLGEEPVGAPATVFPAAITSAHLVNAATVAIEWIRARRATWPATSVPAPVLAPGPAPSPRQVQRQDPPYVPPSSRVEIPDPVVYVEPVQRDEEFSQEPAGPSAMSRAADAILDSRASIVTWLPRVAALVVAAGLIWAVVAYWPDLQASLTSATSKAQPASPDAEPAEPAPTRRGVSAPTADSADSRVSGWIAVFSPFEVQVSEGARGISLDERSRAMLPAGAHTLVFRNRALGYEETRAVQIKSTQTTTLNLIPQTRISVTSTEPAEVMIDGASAGETPLNAHRIDLGTHTVVVKSAGGERQVTITATSKPVQVDVDFSKP